MTSRQLPPPATSIISYHTQQSHLLYFAIAAAIPFVIFLLLVLLLIYTYFHHYQSPNLPFSTPLHYSLRRFSYKELHTATAGFAPSRSLGRGATATVFLGILADGKSVAIKLLDLPPTPTALSSGDHEFPNELQVLSNLGHSAFIVSLLGYCIEGNHRHLIVYEYMSNGSLQELLFNPHRQLIDWSRRFQIILDLAKGLTFLHLSNPPIIHGDIKPSNILLGHDLQAKISDFGLSRLKIKAAASATAELFSQALLYGSTHLNITLPIRPSSCLTHEKNVRLMGKESAAVSPCDDELSCIENNDFHLSFPLDDGRDCRWKRDKRSGLSNRGHVRENPALDEVYKSSLEFRNVRLEDGSSDKTLFRDSCLGSNGCNKKERKIIEWWKEEYFEEISKKGKKGLKCFKTSNSCHRDHSSSYNAYNNHRGRTKLNFNISIRNSWKKKKKKKSRLVSNGMSSGDPFSEENSRARSARGTVCYAAPECSDCDNLSEKADIYSFGVLILVLISGRRPIHVLESPMELYRANLINWCRKLAQTGNVLDIVDENLKDSYNKDQVRLCINVALLCLQRMPDLRPDSWDIVKVLDGEKELPVVPFESSPPTIKF